MRCVVGFLGSICQDVATGHQVTHVGVGSENGMKPEYGRSFLSIYSANSHIKERLAWQRAIVDSASVRAPHGGTHTGPSPVDRRKLGSKHHLLVEEHGIPLVLTLTGANRNDITELLELVDKIPRVQGKRGPPRRRPEIVQGDRGYDSEPHRRALKKRGSSHS